MEKKKQSFIVIILVIVAAIVIGIFLRYQHTSPNILKKRDDIVGHYRWKLGK